MTKKDTYGKLKKLINSLTDHQEFSSTACLKELGLKSSSYLNTYLSILKKEGLISRVKKASVYIKNKAKGVENENTNSTTDN